MATRKSEALWQGKLQSGNGKIKLGSGAFEGDLSFDSRFQEGRGTNPEELIAAAHAGCFSMALAHGLEKEGFAPGGIRTTARVSIEKVEDRFKITKSELETEVEVPGLSDDKFQELADAAKTSCPVSQALQGADITLKAKLV